MSEEVAAGAEAEEGETEGGGAPWGRCCLLALLLAAVIVAVPNLLSLGMQRQRGEAAQIGALKAISNAQVLFSEGDADGDGVANYGTLKDLMEFEFIDPVLGAGEKQGCRFEVHLTSDRTTWIAKATSSDASDPRRWYADPQGIYHAARDAKIPDPWDGVHPEGLVLLGQ